MYRNICNKEDFGYEITPTIFTLKGDEKKLIKQVKHKEEAENAKKAGELGVGPKIYHVETCVSQEKKPKFSIEQQRQRARGIRIPEDEIQYDVKEKETHFIVMEKIKGHELRKEEVDEKIDEIYENYSRLFDNGIYLLDMARQNTLIEKHSGKVFLIDYEFLDHSENPEKKPNNLCVIFYSIKNYIKVEAEAGVEAEVEEEKTNEKPIKTTKNNKIKYNKIKKFTDNI